MATVSHVLRTSPYYYLLFVLAIHGADSVRGDILNVGGAVCSSNQCRYVVRVPGGSSWRLTPLAGNAGEPCGVFSQEYDITEQPGGNRLGDGWSTLEVAVPVTSEKLYFCRYESTRPSGARWIHQGVDVFLDSRAVPVQKVNASEPQQETEKSRPTTVSGDGATQNVASLDANEDTQVVQKLDASEAATGKQVERKRTNDVEANKLEVKDNLINKQDTWVDLSHDIDVNNEPGALRPTREEAKDILVLADALTDQYVPLSELNSEYANIEDESNSAKENYGTNDYNVGELDFRLPELEGEVKKIKELGAVDRDVEPLEQDNTVIDLIETVDPNVDLDSNAETVDPSEARAGLRERREAGNEPAATTEEAIIKAEAVRSGRGKEDFSSVRSGSTLKIEGIRVEKSDKSPENHDGIPNVQSGTKMTLRVFGTGLTENTVISFTHDAADWGTPCNFQLKGEFPVKPGSLKDNTAEFDFVAPDPIAGQTFYICAKNLDPQKESKLDDGGGFIHQGSQPWISLMTHVQPLPLWARLILIVLCLMFSALFSGLNLGLMSLDRTELKIIANTGTEQERKYARAIQPVRDHGNYLLCSILLGNVAVNATFTILLDELMSGLFAVIFSTLFIVCLGEIVPQAICSRHGLMIGARSIVVTKAVMGMTAPLAYPVSRLLDYFLGEEIGNVYNRERLKELVKVTNDLNDLDKDEVNIISGALELRKKTVTEVMTKIEDVFMLSSDSVLDFETMSEIIKSGFSRIPVFEGARNNIVTVLFIKDLAFVDPDDNTPLRTLCQFYQNPCNFVFEDTTLDVMFRQFKEGHKGHMAFVHRVNNEGEGDPFYETVGLVTLEDVIEEMIQAEIVDETDVFTDNRSKHRRNRPLNKLQDFGAFAERRENQRIRISPQLTLATFQFLGSTLDAFRPENVSETVLRRLLRQDIIHQIKCKGKDKNDPSTLVYAEGKPVDYFVLILEGRVEVTVGRENLVFEAGPFTYFGVQALTQNVGVAESPTPSAMGSLQNINMDSMLRYTFVPDYSVRAITEVFYITIKRSLYLAAKRATLMEKTSTLTKGGISSGDQFDSEVDKVDRPSTPMELVQVSQLNMFPHSQDSSYLFLPDAPAAADTETKEDEFKQQVARLEELLQSLDEDGSVGGDSKTPTRQISPNLPASSANLPPASASHQTRSSFAPTAAGSPTRPAAPGAPGTPGAPGAPNNGDVTYKFPPSQQIETDEK